jgi:cobalt/nickel transport system permease protein
MHMGNELLTLPAAGALFAGAGTGIAFAAARARRGLDEARAPLLGVLGAFVFAAQMVNFPVLPGTSGHFLGASLLAILLGPHAAALGLSAIVIVQCLVFQDGGLLALGANLLNMALAAPYAAWAAFRAIAPASGEAGRGRFYAAAFAASMASVLAGAILVPIEVAAAGVARIPLPFFLGTLAGVHAVIGAAEGAITFAVLVSLARMRPDLLPGTRPAPGGPPLAAVVLSIGAAALLVAGFLSLAASGKPDGLEATLEKTKAVEGAPADPAARAADRAGERIAILPDYTRPGGGWYWTTVSGLLGCLLVLGLTTAARRAVAARKHGPP